MKFIKKIITFIKIFYQKRKLRKQNKKQPMKSSFINPNATVINVGGETSVLDVDLVDDNVNDKDKKKVRQYTKKIVDILTIMGCIWITWSYVLSTIAVIRFQDVQVLSSLSEEVCRTILGIVVSYCMKSFFESYAKGKNELKEKELNQHEEINIYEEGGVG